MGHGIAMGIIFTLLWGITIWLLASEDGERYAQAQRVNVGNCWPACEPIPEGWEVSTTLIRSAPAQKGGEL